MAIKFYYNKYDHQYKRIDEKTFNKFVLLRKIDSEFELFYVKNKYDLYSDLFEEFGYGVILLILFGFIFGAITNESIILILPLLFWLVFGGGISVYNFIEDFYYYNKFNIKLNIEFNNFKSYNDYLNFVKFEKL
jgi:hypothetical protein